MAGVTHTPSLRPADAVAIYLNIRPRYLVSVEGLVQGGESRASSADDNGGLNMDGISNHPHHYRSS